MKKLTLPILDAVPKDVGVIRLEQVVELQVVEDGVRETRIVPIKSFQVIIVWSANRIPLDVRDGYEMLETKTDAKGTINRRRTLQGAHVARQGRLTPPRAASCPIPLRDTVRGGSHLFIR